MVMSADQELREQLLYLLHGGGAHMNFDQAVADFPMEHINTRPPNVPYTFWHLLEHIRIAQWDILDYIRNPNYVWPNWPADYWPAQNAQADPAKWQATIRQFGDDRKALETIVQDRQTDLTAPLVYARQHNVLREILLVADHTAYHVGELGILRGVMGLWPPERE
jgi:hypothetical protein